MINMEDADAVEQARSCAMLVSRVFASAAFPAGTSSSPPDMEDIIAWPAEGIAHNLLVAPIAEIDKRLATETLQRASRLQLSSQGGHPPKTGRKEAADLDDSRSVVTSREEASEA